MSLRIKDWTMLGLAMLVRIAATYIAFWFITATILLVPVGLMGGVSVREILEGYAGYGASMFRLGGSEWGDFIIWCAILGTAIATIIYLARRIMRAKRGGVGLADVRPTDFG